MRDRSRSRCSTGSRTQEQLPRHVVAAAHRALRARHRARRSALPLTAAGWSPKGERRAFRVHRTTAARSATRTSTSRDAVKRMSADCSPLSPTCPSGACVVAPRQAWSAERAMRVISAVLHLETGGAAGSPRHSSASAVSGAISRDGPSQSTRGVPRGGKAPSRSRTTSNGAVRFAIGVHQLRLRRQLARSSICAEEVHGQMERFRTRPANVRDALAKLSLQPLRRCESRLGERERRGSTSPAG